MVDLNHTLLPSLNCAMQCSWFVSVSKRSSAAGDLYKNKITKYFTTPAFRKYCVCVCVCVCVCAGVCGCGCPGGSTGRVLGLQPSLQPRGHWFESQSGRKKPSQVLQPTSPPICKTGTWSCTGEQSTLAVSHWSLKASVGLRVPTPAVRDTVGAPASSLPGSRRLRSTGT